MFSIVFLCCRWLAIANFPVEHFDVARIIGAKQCFRCEEKKINSYSTEMAKMRRKEKTLNVSEAIAGQRHIHKHIWTHTHTHTKGGVDFFLIHTANRTFSFAEKPKANVNVTLFVKWCFLHIATFFHHFVVFFYFIIPSSIIEMLNL